MVVTACSAPPPAAPPTVPVAPAPPPPPPSDLALPPPSASVVAPLPPAEPAQAGLDRAPVQLATHCTGAPESAEWLPAPIWPLDAVPTPRPNACYLPWSEGDTSLGFACPAGGSIHIDRLGMSACAQPVPRPALVGKMAIAPALLVRALADRSGPQWLTIRVRVLEGFSGGGFSPTGWGSWRVALSERPLEGVLELPWNELARDAPHRIQLEFTVRDEGAGQRDPWVVDVTWPVSC